MYIAHTLARALRRKTISAVLNRGSVAASGARDLLLAVVVVVVVVAVVVVDCRMTFEAPPEPFAQFKQRQQGLFMCYILLNSEPFVFTKSKDVWVMAFIPPLRNA